MAMPQWLSRSIRLPAVCAPMFLVSGVDLVREACKAGIVGGLPLKNARDWSERERWVREIEDARRRHAGERDRVCGPLALNISAGFDPDDVDRSMALARRYGVRILITVGRDPTELIRRAHDQDLIVFHDVTSARFAEKAIAAGVDGLNCIGQGGGGHSGGMNLFPFIRKIRRQFDGVIVLGGGVGDGASIRAAEVLGADLAYLGTRFIATEESMADPEYKEMLVASTSRDLIFTSKVAGLPGNWLVPSLRRVGLDPDNLPEPGGDGRRHAHLPPGATLWKTIWSAGQGIDLIDDIPATAGLVDRLVDEYQQACLTPAHFGPAS